LTINIDLAKLKPSLNYLEPIDTMQERSITHTTFVIERPYAHPPERVFRAFSDPEKKRRWFAEGEGFDVKEFTMDFRVGGFERARFVIKSDNQMNGVPCANDTVYQDIVPNVRIVLAYTMTIGDHRMSASLATFDFRPSGTGTSLVFTEQAAFFERSDGAEMREQGWKQLLESLAREL